MSDRPTIAHPLVPNAAESAGIADQLAVPGRTLVFCDDTDLAGRPVSKMQPDLRILVAVLMRSERHAEMDAAMRAELERFGVPEFHATDIATGNGAWKGKAMSDRVSALRFVADLLAEHATRVGAVWMPKGQYAELRKKAEELGPVGVGFKGGLRRVLVRSVVERLEVGDREAMLWLDQDGPAAAPVVEDWPEARFLIGGGPVVSPSHLVCGLQLADIAAWSVQRFLTRRKRFDDQSTSAIDIVARDVVASFPAGLVSLLDDGQEDWSR